MKKKIYKNIFYPFGYQEILLSKLNPVSFPRKRESRRVEFIDSRLRGNDKNGGGDDKIHVLHAQLRRYNRFNLDTYDQQTGFTLLELLLGISIFAIIALSLYSTLASGIALDRRSQTINKINQEAVWSLEQIVHDMENIVPYDFTNSYPEKFGFTGESDKISFMLPEADGLKVVSYYLHDPGRETVFTTNIGQKSVKNIPIITRTEQNSQARYLIREVQPFIDYLQSGSSEETDIEILSTNVKSEGLRFFYGFLKDENSADIEWQNQWQQKHIPFGVRVEITFLRSDDETTREVLFQKDILIPTGFWGKKEEEQ